MSSVKGVNATKNAANQKIAGYESDGRQKVYFDTYEAAGLENSSDIMVCDPIPLGRQVKAITVMHDALGTSVTLAIGNATTADKYLTATAAATAGKLAADDIDALGVVLTAEEQIVITSAGAAATGTIKVWVETVAV